MAECELCPLHLTAANVCISGRGPSPASVLVVGRSPSPQDDVEGQCFTGKEGVLLRDMLTQSGFTLSNVRFTNAVRCKSAGIMKPSPEAINACHNYLKEEIHEVQPKIIIALGDTALQSLCKLSGVSTKRGQSFPLHKDFDYKCEVWPTYDPGYVLRLPNTRNVVLSDLRRCRDAKLPADEVTWSWWKPGKELPHGTLAYDIETDYDHVTKSGGEQITQAACSDGHTTYVCDAKHLVHFFEALVLPSRNLVGHNSWNFDDPRSGLHSAVDTMGLGYLADETQPLGLEPLCVRYLGVRGWKDAKDAKLGSDAFATYNARDALYTFRLYEHLRQSLGQRFRLTGLLRNAHLALKECTERGVWIDSEAVAKARIHFSAKAEEARKLMPEFHMTTVIKKGEAVEKQIAFNPQSNKHISDWLLDQGLFLPGTASGTASTAAATIASMPQTPAIIALTNYRKAKKAINAFVKPYEKFASEGDGRVHPTYTLLRTATGRTSAKAPNVQQIPREPVLRAMLSASPGNVLVSADYGAIEFRVAAWCAGESGIISRYRENAEWDPHQWFASIIYGRPETGVTKEERQIAKSANFGLLYLAGAEALQAYILKTTGRNVSLVDCTVIHNLWHKTFPGFRGWYKRVRAFIKEHGYAESATGRRRHFNAAGGEITNAMHREAVNFQVQSLAADIALAALHECRIRNMPICAFIHDDIKFEYNAEYWAKYHLEIEYAIRDKMIDSALANLRTNFGVDFDVPLTVEIKTNVK
jgi:uracil-DNA glycosylase family 4